MNPFLVYLLRLLSQSQGQGAGRQNHGPMRAGGGTQGQTPGAQNAGRQLDRSYWNPGGGTMGNDITGGGSVFGGFYRGSPLPSYLGVQPNVGNIGWLGGGKPGQYGSGFNQAPAWGAQNWLQDLLHMSPANQAPYGYGTQGGGLFGTQSGFLTGENVQGQQGAQYHGGGPGMVGFLQGGNSLASMDSRFRGGSGTDGLGQPGVDPYLV